MRGGATRRSFRGLEREGLQRVGLEEAASLLQLFGPLANTRTSGDHEQRKVVTPAIDGVEDVIAQAQSILPPLAPEVERVRSPNRWMALPSLSASKNCHTAFTS